MSAEKSTSDNTMNRDAKVRAQKRDSLAETIARMKKKMAAHLAARKSEKEPDIVTNEYQAAEDSEAIVRLKTGIAFDDLMALHQCEWDANYPENPKRYYSIMARLMELGLVERCERILEDNDVLSFISRVHTIDQLEVLKKICEGDLDALKIEASKYDAIYFNKETAVAATKALASTYGLIKAVVEGTVQNGLAVVRPPGHHAMPAEFCGYCYVNNVAVSARAILDNDKLGIKKILILDYDVHHGQATQQMFYDTNEVLYISIHRYENGKFWPHLRQSNFDFIGKVGTPGLGYNVNIPLNTVGCGDAEYMAIFLNIILPLAFEYQPDLVIFSAGYDSCIGCPEGEMKVTPAFYGHIIKLLSGMANGKLAVVLEGGYYLPSLAEGVTLSLKALLDDPPGLLEPLGAPNASVVNTINNVMAILRKNWRCFYHVIRVQTLQNPGYNMSIRHEQAAPLPPYLVENCYPVQSEELLQKFVKMIEKYVDRTNALVPLSVGYTYHDAMLEHRPDERYTEHPERPERLRAVYELFQQYGLHKRCVQVEHSKATVGQLLSAHDNLYVSKLLRHPYPDVAELCDALSMSAGDSPGAASVHNPFTLDVYTCDGTCNSAMTAAGCVLHLCKAVMEGEVSSGIALVRPPGHHAERSYAGGFCFINNVAIATKWIKMNYPDERIMILDFDIHHGNGTQREFYADNDVLFISIHKFECGDFYPNLRDGGASYTGQNSGIGYNVNIPFNDEKMRDADYFAVFQSIVLPIAYSYAPTVILVSAGFDAGVHDRLGNYNLTPQAFGHFVQLLRPLANGRVVVTMEGGYNICTLKYGMIMCAKALLGDPLPKLKFEEPNVSARDTIQQVIGAQRDSWPILNILHPLFGSRVHSIFLNNGADEVTIEGAVAETAVNLSDVNKNMFPREFEKAPKYE